MIPDTAKSHLIESRVGVDCEVDQVLSTENFHELLSRERVKDVDCILIDEAQFLTSRMVERLRHLVNELGLTVMCFGLKTSYQQTLFEGSKRLLELADTIEELPSVCTVCTRPAVFSQWVNGPTPDGVILIGHDKFEPRCARCFTEDSPH